MQNFVQIENIVEASEAGSSNPTFAAQSAKEGFPLTKTVEPVTAVQPKLLLAVPKHLKAQVPNLKVTPLTDLGPELPEDLRNIDVYEFEPMTIQPFVLHDQDEKQVIATGVVAADEAAVWCHADMLVLSEDPLPITLAVKGPNRWRVAGVMGNMELTQQYIWLGLRIPGLLMLRFRPLELGAMTAQVQLVSDDQPAAPIFTIDVSVRGILPPEQ